MKNKAIILSLPFSGTHFTGWLLDKVFDVDFRFQHFTPGAKDDVVSVLMNLPDWFPIIIPVRDARDVYNSWERRGKSEYELNRCARAQLDMSHLLLGKNVMWFNVGERLIGRREEQLRRLAKTLGVDPERFNLGSWAHSWPRVRADDYNLSGKILKRWARSRNWVLEAESQSNEVTESLSDWVAELHGSSKDAGWWPEEPSIETYATKIALIHSEVSEMLEGLRKGTADDHLPDYPAEAVEAADIFIRLADYCGARGIDLEELVRLKLAYNQQRADHKPENREKDGGKKI